MIIGLGSDLIDIRRLERTLERFGQKALGTGLRHGVFWRDMGVVNLATGQPTMKLTGGALQRLAKITPKGTEAQIALTITDEYPMAQAVVIITAVAKPSQQDGNR